MDTSVTDYKTKSADYLIENGEDFVEFVENMHYTAPLMSTKNTTAWGVYIENFNNTGETYLFKSSTIGLNEDTQDIDIKVIKSWFDTKNVSTYQATKKVKMGIYKIVQYEEGQDIFYSTPQETILIYEQKPSLSFKTANLGSTSSDTDDYGTEYWKTGLNGKYEINGSFWLDKIDLVIIRGEAIDDVGTWKIEGDGTHDYEITYSYSKEHTSIDLAFRFDMILTNGSRVPSTNAVKVTGTNKVNGISIINTTRGVDFSSKHTSSVFARILRLSSVSKRTIKQSDSCYEKSNGGHVGFDSMRSRAQSPSGNLNTIKTLKQGITRHD